jgi:hypothetical protein
MSDLPAGCFRSRCSTQIGHFDLDDIDKFSFDPDGVHVGRLANNRPNVEFQKFTVDFWDWHNPPHRSTLRTTEGRNPL